MEKKKSIFECSEHTIAAIALVETFQIKKFEPDFSAMRASGCFLFLGSVGFGFTDDVPPFGPWAVGSFG